jgi:hypothetical protein
MTRDTKKPDLKVLGIVYLCKMVKYWSDIEYERRFGGGIQTADSGGQSPPPPPPPPTLPEPIGP